MANVIRHRGKVNEAELPDGQKVKRADLLIMKLGEDIVAVEPVPDDSHFLYQRVMPVSNEDLIMLYGGVMPRKLMGNNGMCSCGSEAVILMEGPYSGKAICRVYAQLGNHQTSFKIVDGVMKVDKQTESFQMASVEDILKNDIRNKPVFH